MICDDCKSYTMVKTKRKNKYICKCSFKYKKSKFEQLNDVCGVFEERETPYVVWLLLEMINKNPSPSQEDGNRVVSF